MHKRLIVGFIVVVVALANLYQLRIYLLTAAFNSALAEADIRLLELDGLSLGWRQGDIEKIVLGVGKDQTPQIFQGLHFTYALHNRRLESLTLKYVALSRPPFDGDRLGNSSTKLSDVLRQLMQIPLQAVSVDTLVVDGVYRTGTTPPVSLAATLDNQRLKLELVHNDERVEIELTRLTEIKHTISIVLAASGEPLAQLSGDLSLVEGRHQFEGVGGLQLDSAMPLFDPLIDFSTAPPAVTGNVLFSFSGQFDDEMELPKGLSLDLEVLPETKLGIAQRGMNSDLNFSLSVPQALHISTQYSQAQGLVVLLSGNTLAWTVFERTNQVEAKGQLSDFTCQYTAQINCQLTVEMNVDTATLMFKTQEPVQLKKLSLALAVELELVEDALSVTLQPGKWLAADFLEQGGVRVQKPALIADEVAIGAYDLATGELEFATDKLHFLLPRLQLPELSVATLLDVHTLTLSLDSGGELSGSGGFAADTVNFQRAGTWLPALGIDLKWELGKQRVSLEGQVLGGGQIPFFHIAADYQLESERGTAQIRSSDVSFDYAGRPLSQQFSSWPFEWDIVEGQLSVDVDLAWQGGTELRADIRHKAQGLAGIYKDVGFVGYSSNIEAEFQTPNHFKTSRTATLSVESLDIGVPIEDVQVQFQLDGARQELTVEAAEANVFGGRVWIDQASYRADDPHNPVYVGVTGIDVDKLLQSVGYEAIQGTGIISGLLPLNINSQGVTMKRGMLAAKAPGGVFRYHTEITAGTNPAMVQVIEALKDYRYSIFQVEADYLENGDLLLEMLFRGSNPGLQNGRPIHLNLNVTDNIPTLLKSLQSGRVIADSVSRQLGGG